MNSNDSALAIEIYSSQSSPMHASDFQKDPVKNSHLQNSPPLMGEIVLRVIPMPSDRDQDDAISGGWVMSRMDQAGSVLPGRLSRTRAVLVAVDKLSFVKPVFLGDIVTFHSSLLEIGTTSITVQVTVTTERREGTLKETVACCSMTYVALDAEGRPTAVASSEP